MQKRKSFFPVFLIFFILAILLFVLSRAGYLAGLTGFFEGATLPLQRTVFGTINSDRGETVKLREENAKLASELVKQTEQVHEIQALRDQFETANPSPRTLLPAMVIGGMGETIIIDKGQADGIKKGQVVVVKDNLVGKVDKASQHLSIIRLISSNISFTAKTLKTGSSE